MRRHSRSLLDLIPGAHFSECERACVTMEGNRSSKEGKVVKQTQQTHTLCCSWLWPWQGIVKPIGRPTSGKYACLLGSGSSLKCGTHITDKHDTSSSPSRLSACQWGLHVRLLSQGNKSTNRAFCTSSWKCSSNWHTHRRQVVLCGLSRQVHQSWLLTRPIKHTSYKHFAFCACAWMCVHFVFD